MTGHGIPSCLCGRQWQDHPKEILRIITISDLIEIKEIMVIMVTVNKIVLVFVFIIIIIISTKPYFI